MITYLFNLGVKIGIMACCCLAVTGLYSYKPIQEGVADTKNKIISIVPKAVKETVSPPPTIQQEVLIRVKSLPQRSWDFLIFSVGYLANNTIQRIFDLIFHPLTIALLASYFGIKICGFGISRHVSPQND